MEYHELIAAAEANLRARNILGAYCATEGANYRTGAESNYVNRFNVRYFERYAFRFRLIDSVPASTATTLFGCPLQTPILCGAVSGMNDITDHPLVKVAEGMRDAGSLMCVGIASAEQVAEVLATGARTIRIVKPYRDLDAMLKELREAEQGGAVAVGTDITFFYGGKRGDKVFAPKAMGPKSLADMKTLAAATRLPFIVKGVLSAADAEKALEIGAGAIIVSNHGGAVIDYAAHPLEVLPEIRQVVGHRIPVLVDSGFRRGGDVMKALALGADGVLIGWAITMGLAANGSQGVTEMVNILTAELQRIMSVTGCRDLKQIDRSILVERNLTLGGC
jgi:isopentenyl diphosphate isomerase/L-lactate dehydrogenase-like FMN-dependent dehydrogenase